MEHPSGPLLAWFGHPVTVVATFVLPVNDHVLKAMWPGLVTGKLSDVAGLLVAPPLLALALVLVCAPVLALLRAGPLLPALVRTAAPVAIVATGAGFTAVKVTQEGAELASRAWTAVAIPSRILADPTDLLALPALGAAWLIWRRCEEGRSVRRFRALAVIPVALVAVAATGPVPPPVAVQEVFATDDAITVVVDGGTELSSRDGGRVWWAVSRPESPGTGDSTASPSPSPLPASPEPTPLPYPRSASPEPTPYPRSASPESTPRPTSPSGPTLLEPTPDPESTVPALSPRPRAVPRACLPGDPLRCYRVVPPRLTVDESRDGGDSWHTVWSISEGRQDALRRKVEDDPRVGWRGSTAIAVQSAPGGHVVVAANGHDGIALRDTRGNWRRLGLSDRGFSPEAAPPLEALGADLRAERQTGVLAGLLCLAVGVTMARRPGQTPSGVSPYVLVTVAYLVTFPTGGLPDEGFGVMDGVLLLAGVLLLVPAVISMIMTAIRARMTAPAWFALVAVAFVTPFSIWTLFSAWEVGVIDHYRVAGFLGWLVAGLGMGASVLLGRAGRAGAGRTAQEAEGPGEAG
ncbi:hypothetical protein [Streptosporangium sp. NPDC023615]|uniref:hypothetical protein n=1 Tax=Streptosporangium sp. NPDC023615 TaxID=3154794 RepID=UPI00341ABBB9